MSSCQPIWVFSILAVSYQLNWQVAFHGVWKQSLTELSGGQRSLLALSLVLALLLFKPAPMYLGFDSEIFSWIDIAAALYVSRVRASSFTKKSTLGPRSSIRSEIIFVLIFCMLSSWPPCEFWNSVTFHSAWVCTPRYILDEIDSALDLSHTQNIGHMIRTHFPHSQFIVVSLKEGMFNHANVLFRTRFIDGTSTVTRCAIRDDDDRVAMPPQKKAKKDVQAK